MCRRFIGHEYAQLINAISVSAQKNGLALQFDLQAKYVNQAFAALQFQTGRGE